MFKMRCVNGYAPSLAQNVLALICVPLLAAGVAGAADEIILVSSNYVFDTVASSNGIRTITSADLGGFDANGADKLVVTIGMWSGTTADNNVTNITYGGTPMLSVIEHYTGTDMGNGGEIWYLDNVTNSGDFVIAFEESTANIAFGVYKLSGSATGVAEAVSTKANTYTPEYTNEMAMATTVPGELVIASLARNNVSTPRGAVAPLVDLFNEVSAKFYAGSAYGWIDSPGVILPVIDQIANHVGTICAVRFEPYIAPAGTVIVVR